MPRTEREIMTGWRFAFVPAKPRMAKDCAEEGTDCLLQEQLPGEEEFREVFLPHDWAVEQPFKRSMEQGEPQGFRDRWGVGWYERKLAIPSKKQGYQYFLDFGGIYENSSIWVNGEYVGGRKYGYSSFRVDITEAVREGENKLLIKVDNTLSPVDRWYSGCGIYRTVKLIEVEDRHLDAWKVQIHTGVEGKKGWVEIDAGVRGTVQAVLRETGETGDLVAEAVGAGNGSIRLEVENPHLWSAGTPNLYQLELRLLQEKGPAVCDAICMKIGIRGIAFRPGEGMLVNGRKELLKGVCLHQDVGIRGNAAKKELWARRLADLKEMGCNALRTAHHTPSAEFLDLCDEMGFYVYEECFDKWTGGLYGRYFEKEWEKDVEAMVLRDRNRPSVVIWGVGNEVEFQGQEAMLRRLKMLVDKVKSMDGERPVTCAMNPHFSRERKIDITQVKDIQKLVDEVSQTEIYDNAERVERICRIGALVDILACNYQEQWYPMIHEAMPDKLILGTEVYQYFCGHVDHMQNYTLQNPSLVPEQYEYCIGSMIWTGYDYLGESMGYPAKGWGGALIRTDGSRRASYYILKSYWTREPMLYFAVMDYSLKDEGVKEHWDLPIYAHHWHFPQFSKVVVPYMIATNCEKVEIFEGGRQFSAPDPAACPNRLITGFLPYYPGRIQVVGYIGGKEVCRQELVTPGPAVKLCFEEPEGAKLPTVSMAPTVAMAPAEEGYEILLRATARDGEGNPYFRESSLVRFRAEGPIEILGVDNGDITGNEPYQEDQIHMYHGCASVLVRLTGKPGRAVVRAFAEGMVPGEVVLCIGAHNNSEIL